MNKKELVISTKFDTSDFDKAVESMQKKLKDIYAPADAVRAQTQTASRLERMGMPGIMGNPGQAGNAAATQAARRELEQTIRIEATAAANIGKEIAKKVEETKKLVELQKQLAKGSEDELKNKKQIADLEADIFKQRQQYKGMQQGLGQMTDVAESYHPRNAANMRGAYQAGGMSGVGQWIGNNPGQFGGTMVKGIGSAATVMAGVGAAYEKYAGYDQRLEGARGSGIANSAGRDINDAISGRSAFESIYDDERAQAAGLAADKKNANRRSDRLKGWGSAGLLAGGIATGVASLAGAPFTMGTSTLGLPAAGGMIAAGVAGLSSDRNRGSLFGGKEYEQLLAGQEAGDFRENYENIKNQDPAKKAALENYEANRLREVALQRQLGLSDKGLYGSNGLKAQATANGFVPEQVMGMASSIIGAGGSTSMGKNAVFGSQMERAGLTNAGGILGSLSGGIGGAESTKRATISIMSEAFKIGLDSTNFAEENRRFTQAAANIIGRSGSTSERDQDRIGSMLGQFLSERTNQGVQTASDSYEKFQERGSALGGRRGAMRFSAALKDKNFSKLDTQTLTELLGARPEDIKEDSPAFREIARQAGFKDVGAMQGALGELNKGTRFQVPGNRSKFDKSNSIVQDYMAKTGKTQAEVMEMGKIPGALPAEVEQALGQRAIIGNIEEKGGLKDITANSQIGDMLTDPYSEGRKAAMKSVAGSSLEGSDRMSDKITGSAAQGAELARKKFDELSDSLVKAAEKASKFTEAADKNATALSNAAGANGANRPTANPSNIVAPMLQPQTGKAK